MPLTLINLDPTSGDDLRTASTKTNAAIDVLREAHTVTVSGAVSGTATYTPESLALNLSLSFAQTPWTASNDGAGSGLDADLLDGQQGSFYRNAGNLDAGTLALARLPLGAGNGLDADLLDGQQGSFYRNASSLDSGTVALARIPQGAGSGLNADLLDGKNSSDFVQAGVSNTFTQNNTFNGIEAGTVLDTFKGFTLAGWSLGQYLLIAGTGADKNVYLSTQSGGELLLRPDGNNAAATLAVSASALTYGGYPVYHSRNLVRGADDPGQSIGFTYGAAGRLRTCTRTIAGAQYVATYTYGSDGAITSASIAYAGRTRTYTYTYSAGRLANVLISEA